MIDGIIKALGKLELLIGEIRKASADRQMKAVNFLRRTAKLLDQIAESSAGSSATISARAEIRAHASSPPTLIATLLGSKECQDFVNSLGSSAEAGSTGDELREAAGKMRALATRIELDSNRGGLQAAWILRSVFVIVVVIFLVLLILF